MNTYIIQKYINKMTKKDVYAYALKKGLILNETEVTKTYNYIKNNYKDYFNNNLPKEKLLNDAKSTFTGENNQKFKTLYNEYKDKI